jgi:hypothetical protein
MPQRLKWLPVGAALAATLLLTACERERAEPPQHKAEPPAKPAKPVAPVIRDDSLDRRGVILAALQAMTDAALGHDDAEAQRALRGRKFSVRIRFGCPGMKDPDRYWSYDDKRQVLRVRARSTPTAEALPKSDLIASEYQGMAGFALARPWLLSSGCPVDGFGTMASGAPAIVIAQLFTKADSRVQRPQSDYALTKPLEPIAQPGDGLDLVLSGRLAELSDGRPIHCGAQAGAPACIVSARIDRVAIENPASGETLGEWGSGAGAGGAN